MPYSRVLFRMTLSDLTNQGKIFNVASCGVVERPHDAIAVAELFVGADYKKSAADSRLASVTAA